MGLDVGAIRKYMKKNLLKLAITPGTKGSVNVRPVLTVRVALRNGAPAVV